MSMGSIHVTTIFVKARLGLWGLKAVPIVYLCKIWSMGVGAGSISIISLQASLLFQNGCDVNKDYQN